MMNNLATIAVGLVIKLTTDKLIQMHDITSKHENTTITFDCQIIATDLPKTYVKSANFICDSCGKRHEIFSNGGAKQEATKYQTTFLGEIPIDKDLRMYLLNNN